MKAPRKLLPTVVKAARFNGRLALLSLYHGELGFDQHATAGMARYDTHDGIQQTGTLAVPAHNN